MNTIRSYLKHPDSLGRTLLLGSFFLLLFLDISSFGGKNLRASVASGNWDGWIKLSGSWENSTSLVGTEFEGFAYGGSAEPEGDPSDSNTHLVGWIDFDPHVLGVDFGVEIPGLVSGPPSVSLSGDLAVSYGEDATLAWDTNGADSCVGSGGWSGGKSEGGGEEVIPALVADTSFVLTCSNGFGDAFDSHNVLVNAFDIDASDNPVTVQNLQVSATSTATTLSLTNVSSSFTDSVDLSCSFSGVLSGSRCYFYPPGNEESGGEVGVLTNTGPGTYDTLELKVLVSKNATQGLHSNLITITATNGAGISEDLFLDLSVGKGFKAPGYIER